MSTSTLLTSLFKFKAWANEELFALVRTVDPTQHANERHACIRLLNHIYVVDRIFVAHLSGTTHGYTATNTVETPTLDALAIDVANTDQWLVGHVASLTSDALVKPIDFMFTDASCARMSSEEMLMHVITHGGYHRGAVGRILSHINLGPPRDLFTGFLHKTEPERRART